MHQSLAFIIDCFLSKRANFWVIIISYHSSVKTAKYCDFFIIRISSNLSNIFFSKSTFSRIISGLLSECLPSILSELLILFFQIYLMSTKVSPTFSVLRSFSFDSVILVKSILSFWIANSQFAVFDISDIRIMLRGFG